MASYDMFGKFYDAVMGDRADATEQLGRLIRQRESKGKEYLGACLWHRLGFEAFVETL